MIMSSIGNSSRESVLDDILHYINHNYASNITLENIAPLFGYNSSYLGKIFRKRWVKTLTPMSTMSASNTRWSSSVPQS